MSKKFIFAFLLIIVTAVVLLYNMKGIFTPPRIDVNLVFTSIKGVYISIVFLAFTVTGVLIGLFINRAALRAGSYKKSIESTACSRGR